MALRLQNHRRWRPRTLAHIFARFPRLEEVHYEPWREWNNFGVSTDQQYQFLFESISRRNNNLKRLVVFENFNQQYPAIMQRFQVQLGDGSTRCDSFRKPAPAVSRMIALASLKLEHLAASFIVDASQFFQIEPSWKWPNLTSLALTSGLLTPNGKAAEIEAMLQAAAAAAMKMPQLDTMEIWNGRKGIAAHFKYQASRDRRRATIAWRGTWEMTMGPSVIQAWEAVVQQFDGWRFDVVHEWLDGVAINSHGDAIHYLMLSSQVVRPISLQQIQIEQKFLQGFKTV
ncbi:uncharacterized protein LA080_006462 [Diaporthe eres]|nr:uncharacterized protein LA080_006462 [Diaporthe eres]